MKNEGRPRVLKRFGPVTVVAGLAMGGCAMLPGAGPETGDVVAAKPGVAQIAYKVLDVSKDVVERLNTRKDNTFAGTFPERSGGASEAIGVGDYVAVTIWEAAAGGLFSSTGDNAAKSATIPEQPVSSNGTIVVPYAGVVRVAGSTPTQVKSILERTLAGKAIEPQVLVSVTRNATNTVTVVGEVVKGGVIPLAAPGARVLDAIAAAGGIGAPTYEAFIQLARGGRTVRVPLQAVVDDPRENIPMRPKDTLLVLRAQQTFTAFGTTGASARVPFEAKGLMLDEALAKAGGLNLTASDPSGVFVFRYEKPEVVALVDPENKDLLAGKAEIPIVYRINLREASGLFIAKAFRIHDKDLVYVSSAPSLELQKFLALIGALTQPVQQGISATTAVQRLANN